MLTNNVSSDLIHHNWKATKENIKTFKDLAEKLKLNESDYEKVIISIYFLYTGFAKDYDKAYVGSVEIADEYLTKHHFPEAIILEVKECLKLKTDKENVPSSVAQQVFHDVAFAYYGKKKLKKRITKLWQEKNYLNKEKIDLLTSLEKKLSEMENHDYNTLTAKKLYNYRKSSNLAKLRGYIDSQKSKNSLTSNKTALTMFKTALRNHIDLINIADKKAGIMISINAILMTLMIPILGSYIIDISQFMIPSIILITTCGAAVILATLATRPVDSSGRMSENTKIRGNRSLFHFSNFYKMEKDDYKDAVKDVIVRDRTLENSIITDLFDMGKLVGLKYKRLRLCYLIFAIGIGLTLITFGLTFFLLPSI